MKPLTPEDIERAIIEAFAAVFRRHAQEGRT